MQEQAQVPQQVTPPKSVTTDSSQPILASFKAVAGSNANPVFDVAPPNPHPYPNNVCRFLAHLSKMSPEERVEWDRRIGYFVEEIEFMRALETVE